MDEEKQSEDGSAGAAKGSELEFIRWDEAQMATGVPSIDQQHQDLIRNLNELHRAYLVGASRDDIKKILLFLGRYAETHFKHEEGLMEEYQCPLRALNRNEHAQFLNAYHRLVADFSLEGDPEQMAKEIKNMAARWLSSHICRVDISLRDASIGACGAPKK
jgi:hemerythrin-like metal-binding protein